MADPNFLVGKEIEIDNGQKVVIFPEVWKKYLMVPIDPITKKFHEKFLFDIDNIGICGQVFELVNNMLLNSTYIPPTTNYDMYGLLKQTKLHVYPHPLVIYLGAIKFITSHFKVELTYPNLTVGEIKKPSDSDTNTVLNRNTVRDETDRFPIISHVSNILLKMYKWLRQLFTEFDDICIEDSYSGIYDGIEMSGICDYTERKAKILMVIMSKPAFGIIPEFGPECAAIVEQLMPYKFFPRLITDYFRFGIRTAYINLGKYTTLGKHKIYDTIQMTEQNNRDYYTNLFPNELETS